MAKLKCDQHKRRVIIGKKSFIHRNGDGTACSSPTATIGSETFTPTGVNQFGLIRPPRSVS